MGFKHTGPCWNCRRTSILYYGYDLRGRPIQPMCNTCWDDAVAASVCKMDYLRELEVDWKKDGF